MTPHGNTLLPFIELSNQNSIPRTIHRFIVSVSPEKMSALFLMLQQFPNRAVNRSLHLLVIPLLFGCLLMTSLAYESRHPVPTGVFNVVIPGVCLTVDYKLIITQQHSFTWVLPLHFRMLPIMFLPLPLGKAFGYAVTGVFQFFALP